MKPDELLAMLRVRSWVYKFLAQVLYNEPDKKDLKAFLEENLFSLMVAEGEENSAVADLAQILEDMRSYESEKWEELRQDHIALFSNSGPVLATPWESVYLSEERILYDEHTLVVQDFYKKWGFEAARKEKGPADHAGLECSFMAALTMLCINALQEGKDDEIRHNLLAQSEFLKDHLLLFADQFCASIEAGAKSGLYRCIAQFLPTYLSADAELLQLAQGGEMESEF